MVTEGQGPSGQRGADCGVGVGGRGVVMDPQTVIKVSAESCAATKRTETHANSDCLPGLAACIFTYSITSSVCILTPLCWNSAPSRVEVPEFTPLLRGSIPFLTHAGLELKSPFLDFLYTLWSRECFFYGISVALIQWTTLKRIIKSTKFRAIWFK